MNQYVLFGQSLFQSADQGRQIDRAGILFNFVPDGVEQTDTKGLTLRPPFLEGVPEPEARLICPEWSPP